VEFSVLLGCGKEAARGGTICYGLNNGELRFFTQWKEV